MTFSEARGIFDSREAALMLSHITGASFTEITLNPGRMLSGEDEASYINMVKRRRERVPLQYLLGKWQFMGLELTVNQHVLIPRQDTEALAELAIKDKPRRVLDMCTGSGCIGIALAKLAGASVTAADISGEALEVARQNAELNGVSGKITFVQSDLFENIPPVKFDMIVSNPPYIPSGEIPALQAEVRDYEPLSALDGGADGLDFYRKIIPRARDFLTTVGVIYFEAGPAAGIAGLLEQYGYKNIETAKDLTGYDRVVRGEI